MFNKTTLTLAAVLGAATAQTGPGFPVPASQSLTVSFGNNTVSPAGELIPRPGTIKKWLCEMNRSNAACRDREPSKHQYTGMVGIL